MKSIEDLDECKETRRFALQNPVCKITPLNLSVSSLLSSVSRWNFEQTLSFETFYA